MSAETTASPGVTEAPPAETETGLGRLLSWLLAVCCVAQFMVILDLSIVNVALPSIQSSLGFSSPDLQWVVGRLRDHVRGFLMLGGRAADRFRAAPDDRDRAAPVRARLARRGRRARPGGARRRARAAGLRRRPDGRDRVDPARGEAPPRDRPVGGDERARRRGRRAVRGDHHRSAQLALGAPDQSSDRDRRRAGGAGSCSNAAGRGTRPPSTSPAH